MAARQAAREEADPLVVVACGELEEARQLRLQLLAEAVRQERGGEDEAEADVRVQQARLHPALQEHVQQLEWWG